MKTMSKVLLTSAVVLGVAVGSSVKAADTPLHLQRMQANEIHTVAAYDNTTGTVSSQQNALHLQRGSSNQIQTRPSSSDDRDLVAEMQANPGPPSAKAKQLMYSTQYPQYQIAPVK